jgi:hypothetical protein
MPNKQMNSIKNEEQYEALREKGMSKEKAARIANSSNTGKKGGFEKPLRSEPSLARWFFALQVNLNHLIEVLKACFTKST